MKAVLYHKKGSPDKLIYQEVDKPEAGDDEVLVKVSVASPNAADYRSMKLGIVPRKKIFGSAIAGKVISIGRNVLQFRSGDAVIGDLADFGFGGFAEYAAVPEAALTHLPQSVSFEEAVTLPVAASTALQALRDKGNIQAGQKVLILGSSGGVGTFAVQLARHFGAEVSAVCSSRNLEQSRSLGADIAIDYRQENILRTSKRYDLILAVNGNYPLLACKRLLSPKGIYVMVGGTFRQIFSALIFGRFLSWGSRKVRSLSAKPKQEDMAFVAHLMAEGKLKAVIEKRYPLEKTAEALQYLMQGHAKGKVVIHVETSLS